MSFSTKLHAAARLSIAAATFTLGLFGFATLGATPPSAQAAAAGGQESRTQTRETRVTDDEVWARWVEDDATVVVKARGELTLTEDATEVESLAPRATLLVSEERGRLVRALEVTAGADGRPRRRYTVNGAGREFDGEARAWLARLLPEVANETGLGARARVRRIINQRGAEAAVGEVARLGNDTARRAYTEELFKQAVSDPELLRQLPQRALSQITSDGDKASLLIEHAGLFFDSAAAADAYFEALGTINSSGDRRRVLSALMKSRDLSEENLRRVLRAVGKIDSSGEKAIFLLEFSSRFVNNNTLTQSFYDAVGSISSDGDRARVLSELTKRR